MALTSERQFMETLQKSEHPLITFRKEWSVDAVASALALAKFLEKKGKKVDVVAEGFALPKSLKFLPGAEKIRPSFTHLQKFVIHLDLAKTKIDELSYDIEGDKLRIHVTPKAGRFDGKDVTTASTDFKYDCIITVDTPDYGSLGSLFTANTEFFYDRPTVNIDHEPSNEQYGNLNIVDITATSTAECVHSLLKSTGEHFLTEEIATCLLTGIVSKTRSFKTASVTPRTLDIASELVSAGAKREEIVQNLYRTRAISTLKLWGRALARLKFDPGIKMAWTLLLRQDFIHAGASEEHLVDVIDELIMNSPEAEIIGLLYEQESTTEPGKVAGICALVSSEKHSNSLGLMAGLKPDGTRRMARVCFPATAIMDAERSVMNAIYKSLGKQPKAAPVAPAPAVNADALV
ncbi:MAG TPA: DHH family phosphoesterase [Candidatus Eisenbacteria bacterium]|jgi:nanoRNase/pAp phosphatase (c-di-AMP/oligoRNAs hydrolase)|nr:DHH family phosphoesterase [Candidatus Eisenbacteria bacterium]